MANWPVVEAQVITGEKDWGIAGDSAAEPGPGGLDEMARWLAGALRPGGHLGRKWKVFRSSLKAMQRALEAARQRFSAAAAVPDSSSYAAEWLLDNYFLVQQALRQVAEDMPAGFYRQLPCAVLPAEREMPGLQLAPTCASRPQVLAETLLQYCRLQVDLNQLEHFVDAFQEITPLTTGELWALPAMLRYSLLQHLACAAAALTGVAFTANLAAPGCIDDQAAVSQAIQSLRWVSTVSWEAFVERASRVDRILAQDPLNVYARMDFESRNQYRAVVEKLSRSTGLDEPHTAAAALALAVESQAAGAPERQQHVGYWLIDAGLLALERRLGYRPSLLQRWRRPAARLTLGLYLGGALAIWLVLMLAGLRYLSLNGASAWQTLLFWLLGSLPASGVALGLANWAAVRLVGPRRLPRLAYQLGLPDQYRTAVVIPSLLIDRQEVDWLLRQLEVHYLGNPDPLLRFVLLSDYCDAPEQEMAGDAGLLERAAAGIDELNRRYGSLPGGRQPFLLLHRPREWNAAEGCWMGWERKRGKLAQFNQYLLGQGDPYIRKTGDLQALKGVQYVLTLDADTQLPRGSALRLVATLAHPLNRAQFDSDGRVTAGYTVLQPRIQVHPQAANRSWFSRVNAGECGLDPYTLAVSDVYQDLFGEGIYVGKGLYAVAAFEQCLQGRVPENRLLSHDLFEGLHGRAGLVTDTLLLEDYPQHYLANMHRRHRWVRGDWQIAAWLLPRVPLANHQRAPNPLSLLDRWKILDNLRRSLMPAALFIFLLVGWLVLPGPAWFWTALAVLALATPVLTSWLAARTRRQEKLIRQTSPVALSLAQAAFTLVFLPYEALTKADAVLTTIYRLTVSHRRLLQWRTSAHTLRLFNQERRVGLIWAEMSAAPLAAWIALLAVLVWNPAALLAAAPFLLAWMLSPLLAGWISQPLTGAHPTPTEADERALRRLACRTWLFFERFVTPQDNWLPPDHYQEAPLGVTVHHTSPTNIGLMLVSTLSAHDLGYIGPLSLCLRLDFALDSLARLERHHGHFLNWYETTSLSPLFPRYISTVDSGNLAGCLLTLAAGVREVAQESLFGWHAWQGLLDVLDVLDELLAEHIPDGSRALRDHLDGMRRAVLAVRQRPGEWLALLDWLRGPAAEELGRLAVALASAGPDGMEAATLNDLHIWAGRTTYHLEHMQRELGLLAPWLELLKSPPQLEPGQAAAESPLLALNAALDLQTALGELPDRCDQALELVARLRATLQQRQPGLADAAGPLPALAWCDQLQAALVNGRDYLRSFLGDVQRVSDQALELFQEMDFSFLYSPQRRLFHIGYNLDLEKLDDNYYDLLASEARLASYLAIARGDVPQEHWLQLARPITRLDGHLVLLSWSGTMFEYLMPDLLMMRTQGSLLEQSCRGAVQWQAAYGRQLRLPWGVSECGYYHFDAAQNYQYRAFGVPGLGFKRGLGDDRVVAPYAACLAVAYDPAAALANLERLAALKALGTYGFYDALDYTRSRLPAGSPYEVVCSYYAHHQGMALAALANTLTGDALVRRFHSWPLVQSCELLLHEFMPRSVPIEKPHPDLAPVTHALHVPPRLQPWKPVMNAGLPQALLLSNGRFNTVITQHGSGYCAWNGQALTRWRPDATLDDWGLWIYLVDQHTGATWSAAGQPLGPPPDGSQVEFSHSMASFQRQDQAITTRLEISVAPEDDLEIRRLTLMNHADQPRRIGVFSFGEVAAGSPAEDRRHPAFNKLFIQAEKLAGSTGLLFSRRQRSAADEPLYLYHVLAWEGEDLPRTWLCDSRPVFLGRGGDIRAPLALRQPVFDGGSAPDLAGDLDPAFSIGVDVELPPHRSVQLAFLTGAARTRQQALERAARCRTWAAVERAFEQARAFSEQVLNGLEMSSEQLAHAQALLSLLLYPQPALRAPAAVLRANALGQPGLWKYAISGDEPIILVRVHDEADCHLVPELLKLHACWRSYNQAVDLVFLNLHDDGYNQDLNTLLLRTLHQAGADLWLNRRGGIFLLHGSDMPQPDRVLLESCARLVLDGGQGPLDRQLAAVLRPPPGMLPQFVATLPAGGEEIAPDDWISRPASAGAGPAPQGRLAAGEPPDLRFSNGLGGFSPDGREYCLLLHSGQTTPAPWINVIANPGFGFTISESGGGYSWAGNSGENRLTTWRNDPLLDLPAEALYLRDEETGQVWSPTPLPVHGGAAYRVRHGAGYTIFEHASHGLRQQLCLFVDPDAPLKYMRLRLENTLQRTRRVTVTAYAEWVLGPERSAMQPFILSEFDTTCSAILARNPYSPEAGQAVAFLASSREPTGLTTDRLEFLGCCGSLRAPAALRRVGLTGCLEAGRDPCAVLQNLLWLAPGETKEVTFLLGQAPGRAEVQRLLAHNREISAIQAAWERSNQFWDQLLGALQVHTPEPEMDVLLNRWLLYQALAARIWGRSALYQSSGAYGFRDQLQDVLCLLHAAPHLARAHLLDAASRQFETGDVLHWWHPPSGRGVRTRCSDDLLWLPYVTARYVTATNDLDVLRVDVAYLGGEPLADGEHERYGAYPQAARSGALLEHCQRALERGLTTGPHGLPLMGSHDWNDGLNRVGRAGRGESVWNAWFLCDTLQRFADLLDRHGDRAQAVLRRRQALHLAAQVEQHAWDGAWYLRAFYDDGAALGSASSEEAQIDSLPQSWAAICGMADPVRTRQALEAVWSRLVRPEERLVLLFDPPFDHGRRDPGYVKGYYPGVRENGGQYTHAATWVGWAFASLGDGQRAAQIFRLLNPLLHADTPEKMQRYRVEPYVVAADVYSQPPFTGRGGWTWYTGSAAWMYRLGIEAILGLHREGDELHLRPCLPPEWPVCQVDYRCEAAVLHIRLENPAGTGGGLCSLTLDGQPCPGGRVSLPTSGEHWVVGQVGFTSFPRG